MLSKNAAMLEKMIAVVINTKFPDAPPSEEDFMAEATGLRVVVPVSDQEFEQILKNLKAALLIAMDIGVFISDPDSDHQPWLSGRRAETEWFYWNRYKKYLEITKGWNTRVTATLDNVSDEILNLLGDPKSPTPWRRRGLVIGDVQSGKTANYTAICNKAADTGYKVIIVLAGITDNLRRQTQERLDKEFAGRLSKHLLNSKEIQPNVFDGVGKIDAGKRITAFTTVLTDFNSFILNSNDLSLKNLTEPALFVVKKNSTVLEKLERWLCTNNEGPNGKIDMPLLLIDDEADNASVNTSKPEQNPTAVNRAIRSIMKRFTKSSYLGITATPFANIFINPETTDEKVGDDLFPEDFVYLLRAPSNYIGADAIYGDDPKYSTCLEEIREDEMNAFFPFKHKKDLAVDDLPPSLYEALDYFVLVNAVRDERGDLTDHRSMLINISKYNNVQIKIKELIVEWLVQLRSDIANYASYHEAKAMEISTLRRLKSVWDKHQLTAKTGASWLTVQQQYLLNAAGPIEVRAVNQKTGAASLDYSAHPGGFRVVAVGGNSLSRGLTLEGLCVSYIYRNSKMYDTLLQMGRWFGYRPNYDDLFKVWMAEEAIDWYGHITAATNELKDLISKMNLQQLTPKDFGLKVRQHPGSLIATALNKMRTATTVTVPISIHGQLLETPRLKSKPAVLEANEKAFRLFVAHLDSAGKRVEGNDNTHLWEDIPKQLVTDLLRSFDTHPWHLAFQGSAIADFIAASSDLSDWTVYMPSGNGPAQCVFDGAYETITIKAQGRRIDLDASAGMLKVSGTKVRVGSGECTRFGLTASQISDVRKKWKEKEGSKNVPDRAYLMVEGRKPLLMLHVVTPKPKSPQLPELLFALGIGIPGDERATETATYSINLVELRNWMEIDQDGDDDDVD